MMIHLKNESKQKKNVKVSLTYNNDEIWFKLLDPDKSIYDQIMI